MLDDHAVNARMIAGAREHANVVRPAFLTHLFRSWARYCMNLPLLKFSLGFIGFIF